jgi:hypothetical protein
MVAMSWPLGRLHHVTWRHTGLFTYQTSCVGNISDSSSRLMSAQERIVLTVLPVNWANQANAADSASHLVN